jgi:hypothetical protein
LLPKTSWKPSLFLAPVKSTGPAFESENGGDLESKFGDSPKSRNLDLAVRCDFDVAGFKIAMNDALFVRGLEGRGDLKR